MGISSKGVLLFQLQVHLLFIMFIKVCQCYLVIIKGFVGKKCFICFMRNMNVSKIILKRYIQSNFRFWFKLKTFGIGQILHQIICPFCKRPLDFFNGNMLKVQNNG